MDETTDTDFYIQAIRAILDEFRSVIGDKTAMIQARKAPVKIGSDNEIDGYYGQGKDVLDILVRQFEDIFGTGMARARARTALREITEPDDERVPERIRRSEETAGTGLFERLHRFLTGENS